MGKLIVIEGLDGSGKSTQTPILAEELMAQGKNVRVVSFPDYENDSSMLVRMYLSGAFGTKPGDVNAYAASTFYAVDRYASYVQQWKEFYEQSDSVVIATRYVSSNEIHQLAKLDRGDWNDYINWEEDFEFNKLGIPRPDLVLYLDMKYEIAMSLVSGRSESTGQKKDIHELDEDYMERCHKAAAYASDRLGWQTVVCYEGKQPLPQEEIAEKILEKVTMLLDIA
jgi:dTMP kinase